ncbi:MAG: mycothiol synthase [Acidimicrobiia bacterium]
MFDVAVLPELDPETRTAIETLALLAEGTDGYSSLGDHQELQLQFARSGEFTAITARDGRRLVGYGHLSTDAAGLSLQILTHPGRRFAGVERAIADAAHQLATEKGLELTLWKMRAAFADDVLAGEFGLLPYRDVLELHCILPRKEKANWPDDITVRTFDPAEDRDRWLAANARIFADHPEQATIDSVGLDRRSRSPWFDPTGFILAEDPARNVIGFCWTKLHRPHALGEIYVIGVDPQRRSVGLGRALVLAGLDHLAGNGAALGMLHVEATNAPARALYEHLGFREVHRSRAYRAVIAE